MKNNTITLVTNGSMTGTTTINSPAIPVDQAWGYAVHAVWTGTPTGTLKLQASCDAPLLTNQTSSGVTTVTNWTDITSSSVAVAGAAGDYMWNVTTGSYRFFRLVYTNISGTGTLNALTNVKGV